MTRNDRKYQLLNVNLRLFKSNSLKSRIFSIYKCCFYYDMISKRERRAIYVQIIYTRLRKGSSKQTHNKFACHFINRTIKDQFGPSFLVVLLYLSGILYILLYCFLFEIYHLYPFLVQVVPIPTVFFYPTPPVPL